MQDDIVIVAAARTPVGAFNGAFGNLPAHELGSIAIKAVLQRAGVEGGQVSEVIMGQILTAGEGQNPARQASIASGIPVGWRASGRSQMDRSRPDQACRMERQQGRGDKSNVGFLVAG